MTTEELKNRLRCEIAKLDELADNGLDLTDWQTGKSVGFVTVLQWLEEEGLSDEV